MTLNCVQMTLLNKVYILFYFTRYACIHILPLKTFENYFVNATTKLCVRLWFINQNNIEFAKEKLLLVEDFSADIYNLNIINAAILRSVVKKKVPYYETLYYSLHCIIAVITYTACIFELYNCCKFRLSFRSKWFNVMDS